MATASHKASKVSAGLAKVIDSIRFVARQQECEAEFVYLSLATVLSDIAAHAGR
jgi:hypothetical protein